MKKSAKVLVFDPYLRVLGGGERVVWAVAGWWRNEGATVALAGPELPDTVTLKKFGFDTSLSLKRIALTELPEASAQYDVLVYLTNAVPVPSRAPESYLIVQFPFQPLVGYQRPRARFRQLQRLAGYQSVVYSRYVQEWLRKRWKQPSRILPPPVELGRYRPERKGPTILGVGRFFPGGHNKRQDALIQAYLLLPESVRKAWRLVLVGGVKHQPKHLAYVDQLRQTAQGERIELVINADQSELVQLYESASLFWHATGYGRTAHTPEKAEHFGITTIEAMSYGCVPLAYADGGQTEIIDPTFGVLWHSLSELASRSQYLIADQTARRERAEMAAQTAQQYDAAAFRQHCHEVFDGSG